jgi:succinyl-diaminopimelate desuccinylase
MTDLAALAARVDAVIERRRDLYLNLVAGLLRFKTVSGSLDADLQQRFDEQRKRCLDYLRLEAERLGMEFRTYADRAAVAELPAPAGEAFGIATHIDVVPADGSWTHPPFAGAVVEDEIWGRGTQDDKGPAAMAFSALDVLLQLGLQPQRPVRLLFGTEEETPRWDDLSLLIDAGEVPATVLVPDGRYPIINGEKGLAIVEWRARWPARPPSPAPGLRLEKLVAGQRHNMVPRLARMVLATHASHAETMARDLAQAALELERNVPGADVSVCDPRIDGDRARFEVDCRGVGVHGSHPERGHNAALDALALLETVLEAPAGLLELIALLRRACGALDGAGVDLQTDHPQLGGTTINLGVLELEPDGGRAEIDIRFPVDLAKHEVVARMGAVAGAAAEGAELSLVSREIGTGHEALYTSPEEHPELLGTLVDVYEAALGRRPGFDTLAGTTYAKAFPVAVVMGPVDEPGGEADLTHQPDERVAVQRHLDNIKLYALATAVLAFGKG